MKKGNYRMLVRNLRKEEENKCSEQFYCGFENDVYNKKCLKQCDDCMFIERL